MSSLEALQMQQTCLSPIFPLTARKLLLEGSAKFAISAQSVAFIRRRSGLGTLADFGTFVASDDAWEMAALTTLRGGREDTARRLGAAGLEREAGLLGGMCGSSKH